MKTILKKIAPLIFSVLVFLCIPSMDASAASVSVSGGQYNVGSNVKVTINFTADATLYAVEVDASYNSAVLRLNSVSGADYTASNGNIKIVDDAFSATSATRTASYTLNFTAIAAGNSNISVSVLGGGAATSKASGSSTINVVTPKPSSNANLSSIKVSGASLSPAFSAGITSYTATVGYSVESVNITASVADGGATYVGGGTLPLAVGKNSRTITVTAADNSKKSYTIEITRLSEAETKALEEEARNANPFLVVTDAGDLYISKDLSGVEIPAGYSQATAVRKETEIPVIKDANGKYELYWLTTESGENGAFYTRDENDNFSRLLYLRAYNKLYIIEPMDAEVTLSDEFVQGQYLLGETSVDCFKYAAEELDAYCIFYCYENGATAYYRYDSEENTMQRAKDFELMLQGDELEVEKAEKEAAPFFAFLEKYHLYVIAGLGAALVIVSIVLICVAAKKADKQPKAVEQQPKEKKRKHDARRRKAMKRLEKQRMNEDK